MTIRSDPHNCARGRSGSSAGGQVQHSLSVGGFPAPQLLVPPERLGQLGVSAEALIDGGGLLAAEQDSAARFAEALALLVRTGPDPATVSTADQCLRPGPIHRRDAATSRADHNTAPGEQPFHRPLLEDA
jgi:hypothetical protein